MYISKGNRKLKKNDNSIFLIWNLPSQISCPFKTCNCQKLCYAKKAEKMYQGVLECRLKNLQESKQDDFSEKMINEINTFLAKPSFEGKMVYFRIHESGDFYSEEYFRKWMYIAKHFINNSNITFLAYTKSLPYFQKLQYNISQNLVIRHSLWNDTKEEYSSYIKENNLPLFTALTKQEIEADTSFYHCVGDCSICKACYSNKVKKIACKIH